MAPQSIARRLAESYLEQLIEDDHLPEITCEDGGALPTAEIVERILDVGAVKVERKRTREHGEIVVLTFALEPDAGGTGADAVPDGDV